MSRPPVFPVEDKVRIVLSVLAGEVTVAEAARRAKVSEQSVGTWKRQFLEAGKLGLAAGGSSRPSSREEQLVAQVEDLTTALGEAHVELRVWKKSAELEI
jgi:transposase